VDRGGDQVRDNCRVGGVRMLLDARVGCIKPAFLEQAPEPFG